MLASIFAPRAAAQPAAPSRDPAQLAGVVALLASLPASSPAAVAPARELAELVAWADQNSVQPVLDKFWETRGMALLVDKALAADSCAELQVQVLQTASILVQGLRSETSLYQLLSMDRLNALIQKDFGPDEELTAHYVSLLKTIAVRMDATSLHFFFDPARASFPLYTRALALFGAAESMVRKAVRSIVLLVMRIDDASLRAFIAARADDFKAMARFVAGRLPLVEALVAQEPSGGGDTRDEAWAGHVEGLLLDVADDVGFFQDAYALGGEFADALDTALKGEAWAAVLARPRTPAGLLVVAQAVVRLPRCTPQLGPALDWEPLLRDEACAEETVGALCVALFAAAACAGEHCPAGLLPRRLRTSNRLMRELTGESDGDAGEPYALALVGCLAAHLGRPFIRAGVHRLIAKLIVFLAHDDRETGPMLVPEHRALMDAAYARAAKEVRALPRDETLLDALDVEWRDITAGGPLDVAALCARAELLADLPWSPSLALRSPRGETERARAAVHSFVVVRLARSTLRGERDVALSALGRADVVRQGAQLDLRRCEVVPVTAGGARLAMVLVAGALVLVRPADAAMREGACACVAPLQAVRSVRVRGNTGVSVALARQVALARRSSAGGGDAGGWELQLEFDSELKALFAKEQVERAAARAAQLKLQRVDALLDGGGGGG